MWTSETGPGRLATSAEGKMGEKCDKWAIKMLNGRIILNELLPNSNKVMFAMDENFHSFKCATCDYTHVIYACTINANEKAVARRKLDITKCLAEGLEVPPEEHAR